MRELEDTGVLRAALQDAREYTVHLYAHLDERQREFPCIRLVNPPSWELAHVGWFHEYWCVRQRVGGAPAASCLEGADALLNSALIPHDERWNRPALTWAVALDYLSRTFDSTLRALDRLGDGDRYFFELALYHEDMHGEALLMSLQTLGLPAPPSLAGSALPAPGPQTVSGDEVCFDGGTIALGSRGGPDFAFDNEMPPCTVTVEPFALATATVTNGEFAQFVAEGGYARPEWWSEAGWNWLASSGAQAPRQWQRVDGTWMERWFDDLRPLDPQAPVMHVNAYEAEAYCRFAGGRLPTEAQWEFAARHGHPAGEDRHPWGLVPLPRGEVNLDGAFGGPVAARALPRADSADGVRQLLGNVWEWTATAFDGYPGFRPGPYREYSQPWFGDHRVLRGGSFATRSRLACNRYRNFYMPERRDMFCGFRLARSLRA